MTQLRATHPQLLGIAVSGYSTENDVRESQRVGFMRHLTVRTTQYRSTATLLAVSRAHSTDRNTYCYQKPVTMAALREALQEAKTALGK